MLKSKKSTKIQRKQLKFSTRTNKTKESKFNHYENLSTIKTSIKHMSDQENSDSSLELFNTLKPKSKKYNKKRLCSNVKFLGEIDLTNELLNESKNTKFKKNVDINNPTIYNISSSSNESFKTSSSSFSNFKNVCDGNQDFQNSDKSHTKFSHNFGSDHLPHSDHSALELDYNNSNSVGHENVTENNCITPKEKGIKIISESAKLLDRIYGKKWREIDGVIKDPKKIVFADDSFVKSNEINGDNNDNDDDNDFENSFSCEVLTKNSKYLLERSFQNEIENTSVILENISLTDDQLKIDAVAKIDNQENLNISTQKDKNEFKDIKQIKKFKPLKKDEAHNSEATLSFLSSLSCFTGSMKCDPEAEKYKSKFKKNKDALVSVLFKLFNEEVFNNKLPADLNFKWNARLRSTAGACFNKRSVKINENLDCERVSRIELSSKIIDTTERLRDTLIHELCHAACWIFNGISDGHGPVWKGWANKAMEKFPELPLIKRCHSYEIQTKFTYKCKKCGYSFGRHSKSLNLEKKRCGYCYGEFELILNQPNYLPENNFPVVYTDPLKELYKLNDVQVKPKLPKKPSKFALFVKENYSRVKKDNPLSKHGEIMKLLGSKFTTTKILTSDEIFNQLLDS